MYTNETYNQKKVSGSKALECVKSGDRVVIGHCSAEPSYLVELLVKNKEKYKDVEIVQLLPLGAAPYTEKGMEKHFKYNSIFVGSSTRNAVAEGGADFTPCFFNQVPSLFRTTFVVKL